MKVKCRWTAEIKRLDGRVEKQKGLNLVTLAGKQHFADRIIESAPATRIGWMALGSGTTPPDEGDTTLVSEIATSRTAVTTAGATGKDAIVTATITNGSAGPWNVNEVGLFNAAVAGTMPSRFLIQNVTLAVGESIDFTWTLDVGG